MDTRKESQEMQEIQEIQEMQERGWRRFGRRLTPPRRYRR